MSTENAATNSPVTDSQSIQKINLNCPIKKAELNQIMTRKKSFELGHGTNIKTIVKGDINKILDVTLLQVCITTPAICSHSKSKQRKLELWQDDAKRNGLSEKLFLKCTLCFNEVEFQTSKRMKNKVNRKKNV